MLSHVMVTSRVSMAVARTILVKMEEHVQKAAKDTKLQEVERLDCIQPLMTAINLSISDFDPEPGFAWNLTQSFSRSTTDLVWISVSM